MISVSCNHMCFKTDVGGGLCDELYATSENGDRGLGHVISCDGGSHGGSRKFDADLAYRRVGMGLWGTLEEIGGAMDKVLTQHLL